MAYEGQTFTNARTGQEMTFVELGERLRIRSVHPPGDAREALVAAVGEARPATDGVSAGSLTEEERAVLVLLAGDLPYAGIAERLGRSTAEVRDHVRRIRRHLGAVTRDEAVTLARRRELL